MRSWIILGLLGMGLITMLTLARDHVNYRCGDATYTIWPEPGCIELATGEMID